MSAPKKVEVTWVDACSYKGAWMSDEETKEWGNEGLVCTSVGFLVHRTRKGIMLAMSCHEGNGINWGGAWLIPAGCVTRVRKIR